MQDKNLVISQALMQQTVQYLVTVSTGGHPIAGEFRDNLVSALMQLKPAEEPTVAPPEPPRS